MSSLQRAVIQRGDGSVRLQRYRGNLVPTINGRMKRPLQGNGVNGERASDRKVSNAPEVEQEGIDLSRIGSAEMGTTFGNQPSEPYRGEQRGNRDSRFSLQDP